MIILICLVYVVAGLYFILTGLRGVVGKKPFVFPSKSSFWIIALSVVPIIIFPIYFIWKLYFSSSRYYESFNWSVALPFLFPFLIVPLLLGFLWRFMNGYSVLGVTEDTFRQGLFSVLQDLRLPFEERLSNLRLTSLNADLQINVADSIGKAGIRIKQREHQKTLDQIGEGLKNYFAASHVGVNITIFVLYIIVGVIILAAAVFLGYFLSTRLIF